MSYLTKFISNNCLKEWRDLITLILLGLIVSTPSITLGQAANTSGTQETSYGVGFQSSYPAWGISGMMDLNEDISAQAILGLLGNLQTFAGRGLYRFRQEEEWNMYGYGMLGFWRYSYSTLGSSNNESAVGFGAGVGVEYDWRALNEKLPPLFWNFELGIGIVDLDYYDYSTFAFGAGVQYRFGGKK